MNGNKQEKIKTVGSRICINKKRHEKAKMQLAAKLLQNGSTIQYVADLTELPEETIRELAQNITSKKIL